jgi:hypothetical protein
LFTLFTCNCAFKYYRISCHSVEDFA